METTKSKTPKYEVIRKQLQGAFQSGVYKIGSQLPPQNELARKFDASLLTIRQALGLLEDDGFISREHGRGTFVRATIAPPPPLSKTENNSIALVISETPVKESNYQRTEMKVLDAMLTERDRHLVIATLTVQDIARGTLPPALKNGSVAGVILEHQVQDVHIEFIRHHGFPLVVLGSYPCRLAVPNVIYNQGQAAYLMARALLERKQGPLYFLTEPFRLHYTQELKDGYSRACREADQEERLRMVFDEVNNPAAELRKVIEENPGPFSLLIHANIAHGLIELFKEYRLDLADHPVAIYGSADYVPPNVRARLNQVLLDVSLGSRVVVETLDRVIAGQTVGKVVLEPTLTTGTLNDLFHIEIKWHPPKEAGGFAR